MTTEATVTQIGEHAVVLGGSLAGLAAAAVLAQRFERVTIVERDELPQIGQNRKGAAGATSTSCCPQA